MRSLKAFRTGLFVSSVSAMLLALTVLAPTGAAAAPNSLTAETSDAYMKGSCDFDVVRTNADETITAKLTMRSLENKPSIFTPRRVATATIICTISSSESGFEEYFKTNPSGATIYKSQYVVVDRNFDGYTVCAQIVYTLRTGAGGFTPNQCVSS